jgi:hypothetical protein
LISDAAYWLVPTIKMICEAVWHFDQMLAAGGRGLKRKEMLKQGMHEMCVKEITRLGFFSQWRVGSCL